MKILNLLNKLELASPAYIDIYDIVIHKGFSILLRLLGPITPHITHQLWLDLKYDGIILDAPWPRSSPIVFNVETIEMVVQVDGKLRSRIRVPQDATDEVIESAVIADQKVKQAINGKSIKKIITVPRKLVNVVTAK